jgi:hypothetical protein
MKKEVITGWDYNNTGNGYFFEWISFYDINDWCYDFMESIKCHTVKVTFEDGKITIEEFK